MGEMGDEGWPDGRYVKVGDSANVAVISDPLDTIEPRPEQWVDKEFLKVEKARDLEVDFPVATNSWRLTRETENAEWKLADGKAGEKLDSSKAGSLSSPMSSLSFDDVMPGNVIAASGTDQPVHVKIDTFDNFHYALTVGAKTNDNYPLTVSVSGEVAKERTPQEGEKPEDKAKLDKDFKDAQQKLADKLKQEESYGKWTYLVSSWSLDPVLKDRSQLMEEPAATNSMTSATATNEDSEVVEAIKAIAPSNNPPVNPK
jgi:hypothetical protein